VLAAKDADIWTTRGNTHTPE